MQLPIEARPLEGSYKREGGRGKLGDFGGAECGDLRPVFSEGARWIYQSELSPELPSLTLLSPVAPLPSPVWVVGSEGDGSGCVAGGSG